MKMRKDNNPTIKRLVRFAAAAMLLAALVLCAVACHNKPADTPKDESFYIDRFEDGAEFRLGKDGDLVGRLVVLKAEDGSFNGGMTLYGKDEPMIRVWQEEDRGMQKIYLQTPDGAMLLDSWVDGGQMLRSTVHYNGAGDPEVADDGVRLGLEFPMTDEEKGYVMLTVSDAGTVQFNVYVDRKGSDGTIEKLSAVYVYRFFEQQWSAKDRVASVSQSTTPPGDRGVLNGNYTVTVDIARDGSTRQLQWERKGLGEDGYRFTMTCTQDGKQTAKLQTTSDKYGDVVVENAVFDGDSPFTVDADGRVRRDGNNSLLIGPGARYTYKYNGATTTDVTAEELKTGNIGGFYASLLRTDELYEGDRSVSGQLTRPKYRKYIYLHTYDELSNTAVDTPVAYGEWITDELEAELPGETAASLRLHPAGEDGWDLLCYPVSGATDLGGTAPAADGAGTKVGTVEIGSAKDADGTSVYTGDVKVTVSGAAEFRLYRACDGQVCRVYAQFGDNRRLLATCPAEMGSAPALKVSRYIELEDYNTPLTVNKLFYYVSLPDGTEVARFLTTNDGRFLVRLKADPTVAETADARATDIELEYRFRFDGETTAVSTAATESVVKDGDTIAVASGRTYGREGSTTDILVGMETGEKEEYLFACGQAGSEEVLFNTALSDKDKEISATLRVRERNGALNELIQYRGGLIYVNNVCVDSLSQIPAKTSDRTGNARNYRPAEDWTTVETELLTINIRNVFEYTDAEKALDGTLIRPEKARRVVWVELVERNTGDSWSFPVGYGTWQNTK